MFRARNDLDIILGKRRRILGRQHRRDGSIVTVYGSCIEGMGVTYRRDRHSRQDGRELHRRSHLPTGIRELHRRSHLPTGIRELHRRHGSHLPT